MDDRVVAAVDRHGHAEVEGVAVPDDGARQVADVGAAVGEQPRLGVGLEQGGHAGEVEVVGVLVGDEHAGQAAQVLEAAAEHPRVEQHPGVAVLDEDARVAVAGEPHSPATCGSTSDAICSSGVIVWTSWTAPTAREKPSSARAESSSTTFAVPCETSYR